MSGGTGILPVAAEGGREAHPTTNLMSGGTGKMPVAPIHRIC
ncbi:MAG TPA: hypothetical protein VLA84_19200 [Microcoleus sp.]|nr:hypothetical protein [Microcoleus sp.]